MSFTLTDFPDPLILESGAQVQRDPRRLLLAFREPLKREDVEAMLKGSAFVLEDAGEREIRSQIKELVEKSRPKLRRRETRKEATNAIQLEIEASAKKLKIDPRTLHQKVAHTPLLFWIRSQNGQAIGQEKVDELKTNSEDRLRWVGPVYRSLGAEERDGRVGLFCPLPNVVMVRPAESVNEQALATMVQRLELREFRKRSRNIGKNRYYVLKDSGTATVYQLPRILREDRRLVQEARFEKLYLLSSVNGYVPTDMYYGPDSGDYEGQWNMKAIGAEEGWDFIKQNQIQLHQVTLCILDEDGVLLTHPDLVDPTGNRIVFPHTVRAPGPTDDQLAEGQAPAGEAHGTCCAGIALALMDNNKGIAGLAGFKECRLMPIRYGTSAQALCDGIIYAADKDADIISISSDPYVSDEDMLQLQTVIDYAVKDKGVVICVSSGNANSTAVSRLASCDGVIACGATNPEGERCQPADPVSGRPADWYGDVGGGSNYGDKLSVVAPGVLIPTTTMKNNGKAAYTFTFQKTSAAAPQVAALAALILMINPDLRPAEVRSIIEESAKFLPGYNYDNYPAKPGWNEETGYGLIDVGKALKSVPVP